MRGVFEASLFILGALCVYFRWMRHRTLVSSQWLVGATIASNAADYLVEDRWQIASVQDRGRMMDGDQDALQLLMQHKEECERAAKEREALPE